VNGRLPVRMQAVPVRSYYGYNRGYSPPLRFRTCVTMRALLVRACSPMNKLYVGFKKSIDLPKGGFLFIVPYISFCETSRSWNPTPRADTSIARSSS
jgi:hypothetical protein